MARRQKLWAKAARARLLHILGNKCSVCLETERLTFDCLEPQGHEHHGKDSSARMSFYNAQSRMGNIGILCEQCNALKHNWPRAVWEAALQFIAESEAILRLSHIPGEGTTLNARERRECLREAGRRYDALERQRSGIANPSSTQPQPAECPF